MFENAVKIVQAVTGGEQAIEREPAVHDTEDTMRAVLWQGERSVVCAAVPRPHLFLPGDVVLRVAACSISASDIRAFAGKTRGVGKGCVLGHEAVGEVVERGPDVRRFAIGDRVVVATSLACGSCDRCMREEFSGCREAMLAFSASPGSGSVLLGSVTGSQAELMRVPLADVNCFPVPSSVPDEKALFVPDVLCSSLHAVENASVASGDVVVIWGLGAIGLNAARWCQLRHAKKIIGIDSVKERLDRAAYLLNIAVVDRTGLSSAALVEELLSLLPGGGDACIECVGLRSSMSWLHRLERAVGMESESPEVIQECFSVARPYGRISLTGDYTGVANHFPIGLMVQKHLSLHCGHCSTQKYWSQVMDNVDFGDVDPTFLVTHQVSLEDAPSAYHKALGKEDGVIKVLMRP